MTNSDNPLITCVCTVITLIALMSMYIFILYDNPMVRLYAEAGSVAAMRHLGNPNNHLITISNTVLITFYNTYNMDFMKHLGNVYNPDRIALIALIIAVMISLWYTV